MSLYESVHSEVQSDMRPLLNLELQEWPQDHSSEKLLRIQRSSEDYSRSSKLLSIIISKSSMANIKESIYNMLKDDPTIQGLVSDRIHTWADDKEIREDSETDIFPLITYQKFSPSRINNMNWVRVEFFQISAWSETMLEADDISVAIVELFNRTMKQSWKSCSLTGVSDSHDPITKTYWVHARFSFVVYDPTY